MRPCSQDACTGLLLGLILTGVAPVNGAEPSAQPVLTRVEQIRTLSLAEAAKGYPVHLKGVITYILPQAYMGFFADRTGGVYFLVQPTDRFDVVSGDEVELDSKVAAGVSSPALAEPRIKKLGHTQLPPGAPIEMQQLAGGTLDAQRVEIEGVVRSADPDGGQFGGLNLYSIRLGVWDRVVRFHAPNIPGGWNRLIDSTVRVSGVLGYSASGESVLYSNLPSDVRIGRLGASDPFTAPLIPIPELAHIGPGHDFTHRLRIRGVVIYDRPQSFFFLTGDGASVKVSTRQGGNLNSGDIVEATGFCDPSRKRSGMVDAEFRKIGSASPPDPTPLSGLQWVSLTFDGMLVEVHGKIVSYEKEQNAEVLTLEEQGNIYHAYLPLLLGYPRLAGLAVGSVVKLRGVSQVNTDELSQNQTLEILLRSPQDVTVLDKGSWFNLQRLMIVAAWLAVLVVVAAIWLFLLRRKVRQQTAIIAESFRKEAALERRYRKLFQSATDIIFSVAPDGAISSPNASANEVFGPGAAAEVQDAARRPNLLSIAWPSTSAQTQHWLRRVVAERSTQAFELHVRNARGGESILEISASLVEDAGAVPEIECIARDVTNRKKQQQLQADRNRVLELVAHRSPLEQILRVVENLVDRQIPNACCSIKAVSPRLGGDDLLTSQQPRQAEPDPDLDAFEGRDGSNHLEIRASDDTLLGWLRYARDDSGSLEPGKQLVFDTAVNLAAVAIEYDLLNRKLIHQSQHDALTGLPNRLLYQDRLAQALLRARRHSELLAVMYLDLDHFKDVNDQMGHDAGDILLVEVSRRLRAQLRESDSLARMGGDEFTLVVPELDSREDAGRVAAKLVESLRKPFLISGIEVFTSASVGISMFPEDSEDSSMLQRRADMAMYWAKSLGKSRYEFFKDMPAPGCLTRDSDMPAHSGARSGAAGLDQAAVPGAQGEILSQPGKQNGHSE